MSMLKAARTTMASASVAALLLVSPQSTNNILRPTEPGAPVQQPPRIVRNIQLGETLRQDTTRLEALLTAVPQKGNVLNSYLVNGMTDKGDWCQWGISYDGGLFRPTFQLWKKGNPEPAEILKGPIFNAGDIIDISLGITNGAVFGHAEKIGVSAGPDGLAMIPLRPTEDKKEVTIDFTEYKASLFKGAGMARSLPPFSTSITTEISSIGPIQIARQVWQVVEPTITNDVVVRVSERDYPESNPLSMLNFSESSDTKEVFHKVVSFPCTFSMPESDYAAVGTNNFYVLLFRPDSFMTQSGPFLSTNSTPRVAQH